MDNGENKITPEGIKESAIKMPENWAPENPEHNLSELGSNAIDNAINSSTPDNESVSQTDETFKITEVFPNEPPVSDPESKPTEKLIFDPASIAPQEEGLSPSAEAAAHGIEDLIIRGDDPKDAYVNYQALRKAMNPTAKTGGEEK